MVTLLLGKDVVTARSAELAARSAALTAQGVAPTLAIVRVGEQPGDIAYETGIAKRCEALGVSLRHFRLPETASQEALINVIDECNLDDGIHGCLLLRPLPKRFDEERVRNRILCEKDVDGVTDDSLAGVFTGTDKGYPPCTAQACMEILDHYGITLAGKRAVVIGRSLVVGKPVAMLLLRRDATVTLCHTKTADLPAVCREADILVVAAGRAGVLGADCFTSGQTVLDVGVNVGESGRLCGDVAFAEAERVVGAITPVPGGVGAVTTFVLLKHVLEAAERKAKG